MHYALGMDASLTHSGIVLGAGYPLKKKLEVCRPFEIKSALARHTHAVARLAAITERFLAILEVCEELMPEPRVLCVEGYAFGAEHSRQAALGEWGGQIRLHAWARGWTTIVVAPTTLKRFVLGTGRGSKDLIMMKVLERWGYVATDNNNADAYALMRFGLRFTQHLAGDAAPKEYEAFFQKCEVYPPACSTEAVVTAVTAIDVPRKKPGTSKRRASK